MKRLLFLTLAGLAVVSLAGAASLTDLAGAQEPAATSDTVTVNGVGTVTVVPDEAQLSFGVETRRPTAQAAVAANADAMEKVIAAVRQAGARKVATQWVSVYPFTNETGSVQGYVAANSVSAPADSDAWSHSLAIPKAVEGVSVECHDSSVSGMAWAIRAVFWVRRSDRAIST